MIGGMSVNGSITLQPRQFAAFLSQVFDPSYSFSYYDLNDLAMNRASFCIGEKSYQQTVSCTELIRQLQERIPEAGLNYRVHISPDNAEKFRNHIFYCRQSDGTLSGVFLISENYTEKAKLLSELETLFHLKISDGVTSAPDPTPQTDSLSSLPGMVRQLMKELSIQPSAILTPEEKMALVQGLRERGAFKFKGAVPVVAQLLNSSAPTIYRYLSKLDQKSPSVGGQLGESIRLL